MTSRLVRVITEAAKMRRLQTPPLLSASLQCPRCSDSQFRGGSETFSSPSFAAAECCRACLSEKLEPRMLCTGQLWGVGLVQKSSTHVQEAAAAAFDPLPSRCGKLRRHRCAAKTLTRTRSVCRVRAAAAGRPAR